MALGIWLWVEIRDVTVFSILFISLGFIEVFLGLLGFSSRKSNYRLKFYILILMLIFMA